MPLVLPDGVPSGAVDEQRPQVERQLVQLGLERVGVILDETSQPLAISTLSAWEVTYPGRQGG
ncbi:hypothetical protein [Actinomadura luteofluorescens]|uniref:hypothetical protein n=1 Tax=Actinomadura luteofluorescens TaxID=46163 RepID=UPI003D902D98